MSRPRIGSRSRPSRAEPLRDALNQRIVTAAVGPTCVAALEAAGVAADVVPANPKMGPMIKALMERLAITT
ncbi:MAG: hypothetical protein ACREM1_24595 [Longimicrobiales bacterium]